MREDLAVTWGKVAKRTGNRTDGPKANCPPGRKVRRAVITFVTNSTSDQIDSGGFLAKLRRSRRCSVKAAQHGSVGLFPGIVGSRHGGGELRPKKRPTKGVLSEDRLGL